MDDRFALTHLSPQVLKFNYTIWLRLKEFVCKEVGMMKGGGTATAANDNDDD
jgi:hypothetical protein